MYYEYYDVITREGRRRFFYMGAAESYARDLGKNKVPYFWERRACFHDPRPNRVKKTGWHISYMNNVLGHPLPNEYFEFYEGEGY